MLRKLTQLLFLLLPLFSGAQVNDSLYQVWQDTTVSDSLRAHAYSYYVWLGYIYSNPDTAIELANDLISFSEEVGYDNGQVIGTTMQGVGYYIQGKFPEALKKYQRSLEISQRNENAHGMGGALNNIGLIYEIHDDNEKALWYYERAYEQYEKTGDKSNMGGILGNMGVIQKTLGRPDSALALYEKSNEYFALYEDDRSIAANNANIGAIFSERGEFNKALEYLEDALRVLRENNDDQGSAGVLISMGDIHLELANTEKSILLCREGLQIAERMDLYEKISNGCDCLYRAYKNSGRGDLALQYLEQRNIAVDSLNVRETAQELEKIAFDKAMKEDSIAQYEKTLLLEAEHEAEIAKKNKTRNWVFGVGLLAIIAAVGIQKSRTQLQVEKDRSDDLLLNILPEEIAEELKEKGKADARRYDRVSILFTDFKGFTEQSSKLSPEALVDEINICFQAFDQIVEKYGIEKIKTIGDSYMAVGGLPVDSEDSAKNTVLAALEMQEFITQHKAENEASGQFAFDMRLGIHTGEVIAGIVGTKKFQYDIWGDSVNTASRMESLGEVSKVNISKSTYDLIKNDDQFVFNSRGQINAKGKGSIEMYFVSKST